MKIGVAGLGFMGTTHLQAYGSVPNAEIVALCSDDEARLKGELTAVQGNLDRPGQTLDFSDAARYLEFDDLLADGNVEAVDLSVPSYLHAELAIKALAAGKHVLVEKPMALRGEDCDAMVAASKKAGKVLMVAQVLRFWPDYAAAYEKVRSGALGRVKAALFRRKCAAPAWGQWLKERDKSGGGVFDLLIHDFDFSLHLLGKPDSITAIGVEELDKGIDIVEARLHYPHGAPVVISGGWHHPNGYPFSMEFSIICEGGTLDFHSGLRRLTLFGPEGKGEEVKLSETDGFQAELTAFTEACKKGEAPEKCRPEDSAMATKMTLAMRTSREQGGKPIAP